MGQPAQCFNIDDPIPFWRCLNFMISGIAPLFRMSDHARADHVQVDVDQALDEVVVGRHRCGEVAIFPERALSGFALVVLLRHPAGY